MTDNSVNLFIILGAILTYGSLTILIVRSAVRGARVDPDLAAETRISLATATCERESLEAVVRAMPQGGGLDATEFQRILPARSCGPAQGGRSSRDVTSGGLSS